MKTSFLCFTLYVSVLLIKSPIKAEPPQKQIWDLREAMTAIGAMRRFNGVWISENEIFHFKNNTYRVSNVETGEESAVISDEDWTKLPHDAALQVISSDKKKFLVRYDTELLTRHSFKARCGIYDVETKNLVDIANRERVQLCIVSPTSNRIAYVLDSNVFIRQLDGNEYQLTNDGQVGVIYNGIPDWAYEEVFQSGSALWWSPDGEKLTMGHFNDISVKTYKYFMYDNTLTTGSSDNQYPKEIDLKYPKAGSPNPVVELKIADVKNINQNNSANWKILNAPVDIVSEEHVLKSVTWNGIDQVIVIWSNRRQNKGVVVACDLNGQCKNILTMEECSGWLVASIPQCLSDGKNCLMINWIDDWLQVWKLNLKTGQNNWRSRGNFTVLEIYGYDETSNALYYQATVKNNPVQKHVFKNNVCISCPLTDSYGAKCTNAFAMFSKNLKYYALSCSGPNPLYIKIFRSQDNQEVLNWEDNSAFRQLLNTKLMPKIKFLKISLPDSSKAVVKLYLPTSLNWNNSNTTKKYPLIVHAYGAPNSAVINTEFKVSLSAYYALRYDVIYAEIDTRGSANRGKQYLMSINNHLGTYEVDDPIYIANYLHKNYNFFDEKRSAIWGWSYGGYVTSMALAKDYSNIFKCGIAVAPVTSWKLYDSIYTERFMGLPTKEDNLDNYLASDVTKNVDNFRTHDFLLIHGEADDNVHIQNSWILSKALQKANIAFEEVFYADEDHGLGNVRPHLLTTMERFFAKSLNLQ